MISNIQELKDLIIWAKSQSIQSLKIGDVEFKISDIALSQTLIDKYSETSKTENKASSDTLADTETVDPKEDDELLMWSSR